MLRLLACTVLAVVLVDCCWPPVDAPSDDPATGRPLSVKVAAVQFPSVFGDVAGNRARLSALVEEAAAGGARVVAGDHLRALENISRQLRDETFCRFLKQSKTAVDIQQLLEEADNNQFVS